MSIKENMGLVLRFLSETPREESITGPILAELTNLSPEDINDAVGNLVLTGQLEWIRTLGTGPYDFLSVAITAPGRYEVEREEVPIAVQENKVEMESKITRNVFVVHGRNTMLRDAMFEFLRAIDLHPIEWSEARKFTGKTNPYVGEILDAAFDNAQAIVVLMTPDEIAQLKKEFQKDADSDYEKKPSQQARPNVLFEAGMAMGRNPNRTVLVEVGKLRPFSDIGGRHVVRMDNSVPNRKELAQRLDDADCSVDLGGNDWLSAGDFSIETLDTPKAIAIPALKTTGATSTPKLSVQLFDQSIVPFEYRSSLSMKVPENVNFRPSFGISFVNLTESTVAKGIITSLDFSWSGTKPSNAINLYLPIEKNNWKVLSDSIKNKKIAKFIFRGGEEHKIPFGLPLEWPDFSFQISEKLRGNIIIHYKISSTDTSNDEEGELAIRLN